MLVLSRKPNESVVLPCVETTIRVVSVKPGVVRLGIEGPPDVGAFRAEILSDELRARHPSLLAQSDRFRDSLAEIGHAVRNRVNAATIGLALLHRQIDAGLDEAADETFAKVERELLALQERVDREILEASPPPRAKRSRALVVEDDTNERELLAGFLRLAGLDVSTAPDGEVALEVLRHEPMPDVLLLDMVMPRCDGPTLLRTIRGERDMNAVRVIALSGHSPAHFQLDPPSAGVHKWVHKPVNPETLLRDLGVVLAG